MSDVLHELVSLVKALALELGRTPTRAEFAQRVTGGDYKISRVGGFTPLLQAAGLETYNERRQKNSVKSDKITNAIFNRSIESHLETVSPPVFIERQPWPKIASISDIHWPFSNERVINAFIEFCGDEKPDWVTLNGDAWDMFSHGKFPRSHNVFTPRDEQNTARAMNEKFWADVKRVSPKSKMVQLLGNHDVRPMKRILEAYPEAEDWIAEKLKSLFTFPGVDTIFDATQELIIGDIAIFHGYRTQLGAHRDFTMFNCVNGHTHRGGAVFRQVRGQVLWELNSGLAGNPEAKGLTYRPQKITEWTPGFGAVDKRGPRFISV